MYRVNKTATARGALEQVIRITVENVVKETEKKATLCKPLDNRVRNFLIDKSNEVLTHV